MKADRLAALKILLEVTHEGRSLSDCFHECDFSELNAAWVKELCFGVLRWYEVLQMVLKELLKKPLRSKDADIDIWLMMGIYQLAFMRAPAHAIVSQMVEEVPKVWAKALVNAVLRSYLRLPENKKLFENPKAAFDKHWLFKKIHAAWPQDYLAILEATQQKAPLFLRVNQKKISREDYCLRLKDAGIEAETYPDFPSAVRLKQALPVEKIPGFLEGLVSVQDLSAQAAAVLLDPKPGMSVLDACAAPGGKTAHLLEMAEVVLTAVDISEVRCARIQGNLNRLGLQAKILVADAKNFQEESFDRILLDAPCSATGVMRRHPDIKLHRKPEDLKKIVEEQKVLLETLWRRLKPGGRLLYATCSILPEENTKQIQFFLEKHPEAKRFQEIQWFPKPEGGDGFYYALLEKL